MSAHPEQLRARLVVVDDLRSVRVLVRGLVEPHGFDVVGDAANGEEGVALVAEVQPDIVVMDWAMPLMNGLQATEVIRRRWPQVQVVAYTSTLDAGVQEQFLLAGACEHVRKGDLEELVNALERCADRHAARAGVSRRSGGASR